MKVIFDDSSIVFILEALGYKVQNGYVLHKTGIPMMKNGRQIEAKNIAAISKTHGIVLDDDTLQK